MIERSKVFHHHDRRQERAGDCIVSFLGLKKVADQSPDLCVALARYVAHLVGSEGAPFILHIKYHLVFSFPTS